MNSRLLCAQILSCSLNLYIYYIKKYSVTFLRFIRPVGILSPYYFKQSQTDQLACNRHFVLLLWSFLFGCFKGKIRGRGVVWGVVKYDQMKIFRIIPSRFNYEVNKCNMDTFVALYLNSNQIPPAVPIYLSPFFFEISVVTDYCNCSLQRTSKSLGCIFIIPNFSIN